MIFWNGHARPATHTQGASTPTTSSRTPLTTLPGPCVVGRLVAARTLAGGDI